MSQSNSGFKRIYLASRSPRRRELLTRAGVCFNVLLFRIPPRTDPETEESPIVAETAADYVMRLAGAKAAHGLRLLEKRKLPQFPVLSADTALEVEGEIIGKPTNVADAHTILQRLSGTAHRVLTGVSIATRARQETILDVSEVFFRKLSMQEIRRYVDSGEAMDKAGAYGIQGSAGLFIERIEGSDTGIMGLPLCATGELLKAFGYIW
ncbi:MAG: Maf family nucleotide pyrophosphatase [Betaproteobacteria bacterium]|nr:Maf family nucleotide pyrophosphatase [Betaproteobacteria bacterium]